MSEKRKEKEAPLKGSPIASISGKRLGHYNTRDGGSATVFVHSDYFLAEEGFVLMGVLMDLEDGLLYPSSWNLNGRWIGDGVESPNDLVERVDVIEILVKDKKGGRQPNDG